MIMKRCGGAGAWKTGRIEVALFFPLKLAQRKAPTEKEGMASEFLCLRTTRVQISSPAYISVMVIQ